MTAHTVPDTVGSRRARPGNQTVRLTAAQALMRFLAAQHVERDGVEHRFFGGCFGIFGHGNVAGIGEALFESPELLTYYQARNEQAMVHTAAGYARMRNRLGTLVCTTSIGPGATNMVTGAALATVNRLPVLLLPGDVFASRRPDPVLQQLETPWAGDVSVNDCFRPVSRYFDRIWRPEQVVPAALQAMRVLVNQAETGAVTLAFPQDVQAEAFDCPTAFLDRRVWRIPRTLPDPALLREAAGRIRASRRPLIVAGGGTIYSEATEALRRLCDATGIPVAETQAGKGSLPYDHPSALGAIGVTGTFAANRLAAQADLVVGLGTRWSDFTTASKTLFRNPDVSFVNVNVCDFDAAKHAGLQLVGDARATLEALADQLETWSVDDAYRAEAERLNREWDAEVERLYRLGHGPLPSQAEVIGAVNAFSAATDVVVCAAGSMPGDLHKLWRARDAKQYHVEYGYSCMGYEIAGGLGVKLAAPDREVYVLVGDGSYLMLSGELVTSIQERLKLTVVLVDNHGFNSIGGLSRSLGTDGFGTQYRYRQDGTLGLDSDAAPPPVLPVDLAANAASLGAHVISVRTVEQLRAALQEAKQVERTVVIAVEVDRYESVPGYESWWDVAVSEVSRVPAVQAARAQYERARAAERTHL
ncbi:MAG TPA: 3D-(3,5/4)-trihydroxycyclohexane-1,2-dione acylhydrolase (decyclizing) [Gaiellaceae bacterium]|nr:3D-(3,5/4)-trihydroxycyclohexane-1,2-dione acylhydrolase (decyclizing) [Gaiellaceae bacterium]